MDRIEILPSTIDDIKFFHERLDHTVRAWSVFYNGELASIAGVEITGEVMLAFSHIRDGLSVDKIQIWRAALVIWEKIKGLGYPQMYAIADKDIPKSGQFLKRLGFIKMDTTPMGDRYLWQRLS